MDGGQTQQAQPAAAPARRLQFAQWLRQAAGGPPEEAASEASTSDVDEAELPADPAAPSSSNTNSSSRGSSMLTARGGGAPSQPAAPDTPGQLARHATLAPRLPDCRAEMRLTNDASSRARQEMTVMLAAPGMPLHQAPILTAKQASALMASICEPLLSLPVGRLTRKLSAPTKLQPTEDRGLITLWLLPDDSLSLVWQSAQQLEDPAAPLTPSSSSNSLGSSTSGAAAEQQDSSSSSDGGSQQAPLQQSCSVAVWEELAHFPAMAHLLEDAPGEQPRCCCCQCLCLQHLGGARNVCMLHLLAAQRLPCLLQSDPVTCTLLSPLPCACLPTCPLSACSGDHPHAAWGCLWPLFLHQSAQ
jgi:hypothetical protein